MNNEPLPMYYRYWGKARKREDGKYDYHLLVYHCLDVAAVGRVWLEKNPTFLQRIHQRTGIASVTISAWLQFFFAMHDIGKFARSFQSLCPGLLEILQGDKETKPYIKRHDQLGWGFWEKSVFRELFSLHQKCEVLPTKDFFDIFARVVFGHHGIPPTGDGNIGTTPPTVVVFVKTIFDLFVSKKAIDEFVAAVGQPKQYRATLEASLTNLSWEFAGLVSLCDWLASGDGFTWMGLSDEPIPISDYLSFAVQEAEVVVRKAQVVPATVATEQGLGKLFPAFLHHSTPLQNFCNEVPVSNQPRLWILEDMTGAGKTEAALTLASRIMGAGGGTGCFIALPTMATSNAMYERMANVYSRMFCQDSKPSLVLAHGSKHLSEAFYKSYHDMLDVKLDKIDEYNELIDEGKAHCSQWLADSSKKALLAEVGVGTVDQVLMAGLPVRYQSLRAFGVAQKVLIVDEVHAFDPYMLRLLENLISAQARFGGSVILLSATLPFIVRQRFCCAFATGLEIVAPVLKNLNDFPLVTSLCAENGLEEVSVPTRRTTRKDVRMEFRDNVEVINDLIHKTASEGKCVCWIRNTISDVLESFEQLKQRGIKNLDIFHSRFALKDRLAIEGRVLRRFGKESTSETRTGQVLIASQVVEQSLDLDFDVMISDLAPIDLLIQRAGRLHRHEGRGDRGEPVLIVHTPKACNEPTVRWFSEAFPNAQWVYQDTALLWRTKEILKKQKFLKMPDDARLLIEYVYGDHEPLPVEKVFESDETKAWGKAMAETTLADLNSLDFTKGYNRLSCNQGWGDE